MSGFSSQGTKNRGRTGKINEPCPKRGSGCGEVCKDEPQNQLCVSFPRLKKAKAKIARLCDQTGGFLFSMHYFGQRLYFKVVAYTVKHRNSILNEFQSTTFLLFYESLRFLYRVYANFLLNRMACLACLVRAKNRVS